MNYIFPVHLLHEQQKILSEQNNNKRTGKEENTDIISDKNLLAIDTRI